MDTSTNTFNAQVLALTLAPNQFQRFDQFVPESYMFVGRDEYIIDMDEVNTILEDSHDPFNELAFMTKELIIEVLPDDSEIDISEIGYVHVYSY